MSKSRSNVPVTIFFLCGSVPGKFWLRQFPCTDMPAFILSSFNRKIFYIYWSREAATTLLKLVNGIIFYFLFFFLLLCINK